MKTVIDVKTVGEHYEIYVYGKFYCSCDRNELSETLNEIEQLLKNGG